MVRMIDLEIIAGLKRGDEKAFKSVFKMFYRRLCFFASGIIESEAACDVVQDAFVKLWERKAKFDRLDSIKTFLYQFVKNTCINEYKHKLVAYKYLESTYDPIDEINISHRIIETEVAEEIRRAIQTLAPGYRDVVYLSYFQGMSNQEIAEMLNVSINTVKTQKLRALRLLRQIIKKPLFLIVLSVVGLDCQQISQKSRLSLSSQDASILKNK